MTLRQRVEYGDGGDPDQDAADRGRPPAPATCSAVPSAPTTRPGWSPSGGYDFKGNPLQTTRQVIADAPILATYTAAAANGWQVTPFTVDWTPAPGQTQDARDAELLDPTEYTHDTALRRTEPGHPAHPARRRRRAPRRPHPRLQPGRRAGSGARSTAPCTCSGSPTTPRASAR